jgi:hypothetical protein
MSRLLNAVLILVACIFLTVSAKSPSAKDRLTRELLKDYQVGVDPGTTDLEFGVTAVCARFDKFTKVATLNVWEYHSWKDSRLSWNPADYSGVDKLRIPAKLIWSPDTRIYNSLTAFADREANVNAVVASDGTVLWIPNAAYRIHCTENDGDDTASCKIRIGSWTYDGNNLVLKQHGPDGLDLSNYDEACPSVISSHKAAVVNHKYPCCEEPYPSLDVTFTIKPRAD